MKRVLTFGIVAFFIIVGVLTIYGSISNLKSEKNDSTSIMKRSDEKIYELALKAIGTNSISEVSAIQNRIRSIDQAIRENLNNKKDEKLISYHDKFLILVYRAINEKIEVLKSSDNSNSSLETILANLKENYEQIRGL